MNIAIDLDGTLAALHEAVRDRGWMSWQELSNRTTNPDFNYKEYKHHTTNLWYNHSDEIGLVDEDAPDVMRYIHDNHHTTILTHRVGHDETIMDWLGTHAIPFDDFIATRKRKGEFDMDLYIDDSCVRGNNIIYDRPWNQHLSGERITSFEELYDCC